MSPIRVITLALITLYVIITVACDIVDSMKEPITKLGIAWAVWSFVCSVTTVIWALWWPL